MGGFIQTPALIGEDHCWRENFDDHGGGIAGTQNHLCIATLGSVVS